MPLVLQAPPEVNQFASMFLARFISSRQCQKSIISLMSIKQKPGENLRSYINRFKKEELEARDLDPMISMHAAINKLRAGSALKCSITKTPPKTKLEFLKKAQKYIAAQEALAEDHQEKEAEHNGGPLGKKKKKNEDRRGDSGKDNRKPSAPTTTYSQYTPLNSSWTQILMQIGDEKFVKWLEKLKRNPKKYCKFHRGIGHDAEDCYELKNEIESLIRRGHLKQFVGGEVGASSS
ncbi:PREDICTED: uncharacterized protein LOC104598695 [Nelumbo nucifera]|uniref:Uncharacterized protein LOC104598695 n=1 Tax=Nelumbo nucifera TaxID=4432 RepID=A0A1U8A312_NELNU|nr:PREDICTED: uncharacterized protein LOC104598695 [Nelumbo nucifera]